MLGLDYSRQGQRAPTRGAKRRGWPASFSAMNLYDLRDVLTRGALVARHRSGPQAVYARGLLEALDPDGLDNFWRFTRMVLRGGGRAFLEGQSLSRDDCAEWRAEHAGGRLHPVDPRVVEGQAVQVGRQGGAPGGLPRRRGRPCAAALRPGGG